MRGASQEIETLISEEALLFAKYLRKELEAWKPRGSRALSLIVS